MSSPTCADVFAATLREAGVARIFGLPGGEILDFIHAARRVGIEFLLTRHEAAAAFMADVTGQIQRRPGICVSTLGPGAVNMTLGVANAYLDRSPVLAITATMAAAASPYATHQNLDLNAVYRPFTKWTVTLDGRNTAATVRRALRESMSPRMGPVHIAVPPDVARAPERDTSETAEPGIEPLPVPRAAREALDRGAAMIAAAIRPVLVLGLDLDPRQHAGPVRAFVDRLGVPVFATPKAKGLIPEDHPLFCGICAGVAADSVIVDFFTRADLLVGLGFEPVESDKLWHREMKLLSLGPLTIASGAYRPHAEIVGDVAHTIEALSSRPLGPFGWTGDDLTRLKGQVLEALRPARTPRGLSPFELTRRLRDVLPRDTVLVTDVGAIKSITTQAWTSYEPLTFFESNGLSAMSYGLPGAMAARLQFPDRRVLCTIGDGGFAMTCAEIETCVRERLHFITVVYNDSSLSLIRVAQENRGHAPYGVDHGAVDFAAVARAMGAWARRVETSEELDTAIRDALGVDRPVVIDAIVDPSEYRAQNRPKPR